MKNTYFISRQHYYYSQQYTVEIAYGGIDYANCDMLCSKYPEEGEEFTNPIEAVEAAIKIHQAWKKDNPELEIQIATGFTMGMNMEFEGTDYESLRNWAIEKYAKLEKCDTCGEILPCEYYILDDDEKYCSEFCADKALREREIIE